MKLKKLHHPSSTGKRVLDDPTQVSKRKSPRSSTDVIHTAPKSESGGTAVPEGETTLPAFAAKGQAAGIFDKKNKPPAPAVQLMLHSKARSLINCHNCMIEFQESRCQYVRFMHKHDDDDDENHLEQFKVCSVMN